MSSVASGAPADVASPAEPKPFCFNTSAHLLRIGRERATTLSELLQALRTCSETPIFQHTFRTPQEHHFIREGFSNDFAHWTFTACNVTNVGLAERLAGIDAVARTVHDAWLAPDEQIYKTCVNRFPLLRSRASLRATARHRFVSRLAPVDAVRLAAHASRQLSTVW